jgi:hypothetical protein
MINISKLKLGINSNKDVASCLGVSDETFRKNKEKYLKELSEYCECELVGDSIKRVNIISFNDNQGVSNDDKVSLTIGEKSLRELAGWFGKDASTIRKNKEKYLELLKEYCRYEILPNGKVNILEVYMPTYIENSSNKEIVKNNFTVEWNSNGLDTASNVAKKIRKHQNLTIADSTAYTYTLQARNELFGKPFTNSGEIGFCEYIWCVETSDGKYRELTMEEEKKKRDLMKVYFGDATEKQLMVKAMVEAGEITKEEAFDILERMTGMDDCNFYSFLQELSVTIGCKVKKVTKLLKRAW